MDLPTFSLWHNNGENLLPHLKIIPPCIQGSDLMVQQPDRRDTGLGTVYSVTYTYFHPKQLKTTKKAEMLPSLQACQSNFFLNPS